MNTPTSTCEATIESHTTPLRITPGDLYFREMICGMMIVGRDAVKKLREEASIIDGKINTITANYQRDGNLRNAGLNISQERIGVLEGILANSAGYIPQ